MTTPLNGMGIDLSLKAGLLLAQTVIENGDATAQTLWKYNRDYHILYGSETAKNEGLKNTLLNMTPEAVSFLYEKGVIQATDLAGGGNKMSADAILGKIKSGMNEPKHFLTVVNGIVEGAVLAGALKKPPRNYDEVAVRNWQKSILKKVIKIN